MLHALRMGIVVLAVAGFAFASFGAKPAEAGCQLVTATHSADSKAEAAYQLPSARFAKRLRA